jgi:hypothetical protein
LNETDIEKRHRVTVTSITQKKEADLAAWYSKLPVDPAKRRMLPGDQAKAPSGPGYVFTLQCVHFHHDDSVPNGMGTGANYAIDQVLTNGFHQWEKDAPIRGIGISHATIPVSTTNPRDYDPNFRYSRGQAPPGMGGFGGFGGGHGAEGSDSGPDYMPDQGVSLGGAHGGGAGTPGATMDEYYEQAGGAHGGAPGGLSGLGLPFDPTKLLDDPAKKPSEWRLIQETRFTVEFVWKPMTSLERAKFAVLYDLFSKVPAAASGDSAAPPAEPSLTEANEHLKKFEELPISERHKERLRREKLEITQAEFDTFLNAFNAHKPVAAASTP